MQSHIYSSSKYQCATNKNLIVNEIKRKNRPEEVGYTGIHDTRGERVKPETT